MGFDKESATKWGRIGGTIRTARHDPQEFARAGQGGLLARFAAEIDPDGLLSDEERFKRAVRMRRAHMLRLNLIRTEKRRAARAAEALKA